MKTYLAIAGFAAILPLALCACGDDVTEVTETAMTSVETEAELPACGAYNNGTFVITNDKQKVFVCYSEKWFTLNGNDGSPAQSAAADTATAGKKGADGKNGANGTSCTGVAFERNDSTGFKIVCGTDTVGVILNGTDGISGKNGRHGFVQNLAYKLVKRMKRGVNTAVFASPGKNNYKGFSENGIVSDWALWHDTKNSDRLEKKHFKMIADKGFDHIRFQVRWDTHFTGDSSKCQIDSDYMKQVEWAVENTIQNGMIAVVDEHALIFQQKTTEHAAGNGYSYAQVSPCVKAVYKQIAQAMGRYSPDSVIIELPNEPTTENFITARQWNNLVDSLIQVIHGIDPARVIIVGSRNYYGKDNLGELQLDNSEGLLMASFHYYDPYSFTTGDCPTATKPDTSKCGKEKWEGSQLQKAIIYDDFSYVDQWSRANGNIPIYLGEYGTSYYTQDTVGAEKWLATITQTADEFGFATAIHNFGGDYYVYYFEKDQWANYKLRALFNPKDSFAAPERPVLDTISKKTVIENFETNFPSIKISSDLGSATAWSAYNYCEGDTSCNVTVTTNANGGRSDMVDIATFKTPSGYNGSGLYMKHVSTAPKGVFPYFGLQTDLVKKTGTTPTYFDFSNVKALSFYAKGQGKIKMVLYTAYGDSIAAANHASWTGGFSGELGLSNQWQRYVIWADALVPEKQSNLDSVGGVWSKAKNKVYGIAFKNGVDLTENQTTTVEWYLDDVTVYGMSLSDFQ